MSNYEFRARAKELLAGRYGQVITFIFIIGLITGAFSFLANSFAPVYDYSTFTEIDPGNPFLYRVLGIVSVLVAALASISIIQAFTKVARGEALVIEKDLVFGFKNDPIRTIVAAIVKSIYIFLWTLLLIVPGLMKTYSYAMTEYLLVTDELSGTESITRSKQLMYGHRGQLFMLDLSYLPQYLLGIFTLCILWLWIIPKHQTARVLFFQEIIENTASSSAEFN